VRLTESPLCCAIYANDNNVIINTRNSIGASIFIRD